MSALIYPRKVKVADPKMIFGWESSGFLNSYAPFSRHPDEYKIDNYKTIPLSAMSGYVSAVNSGVIPADDGAHKINSDAFFPPGTRVTMFMMEYEAFDPYTNEWAWVPSTSLLEYDAIWIKESDGYSISSRFNAPETASPRKARIRQVLRQTRLEDWSWTPSAPVPATSLKKYAAGEMIGTYGDASELPVWDVPDTYEHDGSGDRIGIAPMFVVIDKFHKFFRPLNIRPAPLGVAIEPDEVRQPINMENERLSIGSKQWRGNESVSQLCSEILRMVHKVRYET